MVPVIHHLDGTCFSEDEIISDLLKCDYPQGFTNMLLGLAQSYPIDDTNFSSAVIRNIVQYYDLEATHGSIKAFATATRVLERFLKTFAARHMQPPGTFAIRELD